MYNLVPILGELKTLVLNYVNIYMGRVFYHLVVLMVIGIFCPTI